MPRMMTRGAGHRAIDAALHGGVLADVRYALRALRKTPAFTIGAIATIALTVGATTVMFSVVYGVLLRQLPYREAARVFWIWSDQPGRDRTPFNVPDFLDYRAAATTLDGFAGYFAYSANLNSTTSAPGHDEAPSTERVQGLRVTGNLFDVLGMQPRIGRLLRSSDEPPGADHVVVLAEPFWIRRFGGDPAIVGRDIRLNGEAFTIVGVMPAAFAMPIRDVDVVVPFAADRDPRRGARNSVNFIQGVGRLRDRVTLAQATDDLNAIARRLQSQFPVENARKRGVRLVALIEGIAGSFRATLMTVLAAVGAVLLIACANLANLMLTRAMGRRRDIAVQMALGSSRARVVRGVLVEALLVSAIGGVLGALLSAWGVRAIVAFAPAGLPRTGEIRVDVAVLIFSLAVSSIAGVLFGILPAMVSAGVDIREALQASGSGGGRGTTAGGHRLRGLLVSAEVALAVVLLVVMMMLAKSLANVQAVAPGFDTTEVLSARLTLPAARFHTREAIAMFQRTLSERLSSQPAVTHTGAISLLPLSGLLSRVPFTVEGRSIERERVPVAQYRMVSPGYFETARIPLKRGRLFSDRDLDPSRAPAVAVVSEALADRWLRGLGLEPIGARLLVDDNDGAPRPIEIIGVVGNVQQVALDAEPTWDVYIPYAHVHRDNIAAAASNMFWLVRVRAGGDPMQLATMLSKHVREIDADVAASQIKPFDRYLADAMAPRRFSLSLMATFALAALTLALTGIYAVVMYAASQRTQELTIRVALGASRRSIMTLVASHGLRFVLIGLIAGLALSVAATHVLSTLLFGIAPTDVATLTQVAATVAIASLIACAVPAARAGSRMRLLTT